MAFTQQPDGSITNDKGQEVVTKDGVTVTPEVEKTLLQKAQDEIAELKAQIAGKGKKAKAVAPETDNDNPPAE